MDYSTDDEEKNKRHASDEASALDEQSLLSTRRIDQLFEVFNHRASTRTSDGYRAVEKASGHPVVLWRLRYPMLIQSGAVGRYLRRIEKISKFIIPTAPIRHYGVDPDGIAYLATEWVDGKSIFQCAGNVNEAQRLFLSVTRTLVPFHEAGLVLGDICEATFLMRDGGEVFVQGLMGSYESEAKHTALLPSLETLHYVAPEQRSGSGLSLASDVYALGAFGYRLFTGRHVYGDKPPPAGNLDAQLMAPSPTSVRKELPPWVDSMIGKALESQVENRYTSAVSFYNDLQQAISQGDVPYGGGGRWSNRTLIVTPQTAKRLRESSFGTSQAETIPEPPRRSARNKEGRNVAPSLVVGGILLLIALGAGAFLISDNIGFEHGSLESEMALHENAAPPELRQPMRDVIDADLPMTERTKALEKIALSDDPVAYAVLVSLVKRSPTGELKQISQKMLIERMKRQGFPRSAVIIDRWFESLAKIGHDASQAPSYSFLLNACSPQLPLNRRRTALNQAYGKEPIVALQLSAALTLDEKDQQDFLPILRQLLGAHLDRDDLEGKNVWTLMLTSSLFADLLVGDIAEIVPQLENEDIAWLLLQLAESNSPHIYLVGEEILKRNVVPPFQAVFLRTLLDADRPSTPLWVKTAIVHGIRGDLSESDVVSFGRWMSVEAEKVLLAACAIAPNEDVGLAAFDTLAAKVLNDHTVRDLFELIKRKHWEKRTQIVKAVGILGNHSISSPEQIQYAFDAVIPFIGPEGIFSLAKKSGDERLAAISLERFAQLASSEHLVPLLSHPSKRVRMAAIRALQGNNELAVLQSILRAYQKEEDEEVKELYRQLHWVTVGRTQEF